MSTVQLFGPSSPLQESPLGPYVTKPRAETGSYRDAEGVYSTMFHQYDIRAESLAVWQTAQGIGYRGLKLPFGKFETP
jgi:hypothetical protein